jgi:hypothetical protein
MIRLEAAEEPIRQALVELAESPRELRCFVVVENPTTGRFVQFCTPPPPSPFAGSPRIMTAAPLIFDGHGNGKPGGYILVQAPCDVASGVQYALDALLSYLPLEAELKILFGASRRSPPS